VARLAEVVEVHEGVIEKLANPAAELGKMYDVRVGFAADAFLANWDVVGMEYDNLRLGQYTNPQGIKGAAVVRLDTGGGLLYRAQGAAKGKLFGPKVGEIESMRHPVKDVPANAQAHAVFGKMSDTDLILSMQNVEQLSDKTITHLVETFGPGDEKAKAHLAQTLIQRKADIGQQRVALQAKIKAKADLEEAQALAAKAAAEAAHKAEQAAAQAAAEAAAQAAAEAKKAEQVKWAQDLAVKFEQAKQAQLPKPGPLPVTPPAAVKPVPVYTPAVSGAKVGGNAPDSESFIEIKGIVVKVPKGVPVPAGAKTIHPVYPESAMPFKQFMQDVAKHDPDLTFEAGAFGGSHSKEYFAPANVDPGFAYHVPVFVQLSDGTYTKWPPMVPMPVGTKVMNDYTFAQIFLQNPGVAKFVPIHEVSPEVHSYATTKTVKPPVKLSAAKGTKLEEGQTLATSGWLYINPKGDTDVPPKLVYWPKGVPVPATAKVSFNTQKYQQRWVSHILGLQ
jgi:hypothetical protein